MMTPVTSKAPVEKDPYYDTLYDPSFFSHDSYETEIDRNCIVAARNGDLDWKSWRSPQVSSGVARQYFLKFQKCNPREWNTQVAEIGAAAWSLLVLMHAERAYRRGKFEALRKISGALISLGVEPAIQRANKLCRAAEALSLLDLSGLSTGADTPIDRIVDDAVDFVQSRAGDTYGADLRDFVRVEKPVRKDFDARKVHLTNREEVLQFYSNTYSYILELTAANHQVETLNNYQRCLDVVMERGKTSLYDYGCGIGTLALLARKRGISQVTLADLPSPTLEFAKARSKKLNADVSFADLNDCRVNIPPNTDVVCCTEVLEHVFEPDALVKELVSALPKDGHLIVSESFDHIEDFCTHLPIHKGKGGAWFVHFMNVLGWRQVRSTETLHCQVYERG
jgi:2-polyprenyl-3-methyl-5-hydroxy-6-metoxy-1,4-benzoquinol methylase